MTITKVLAGGFDAAEMVAANDAELHARVECDSGQWHFRVALEPVGQHHDDWVFDEAACEEAEEFFRELRLELKRRRES